MGYVIPLFTIKHHRNLEIYLRFTVFGVFFVDFDGKLVICIHRLDQSSEFHTHESTITFDRLSLRKNSEAFNWLSS